jgi:hypothetical protein
MPENIIPAQLSEVSNSNYYGLQATIATWSDKNFYNIPNILDLADIKIMTEKQCSKKCSKIMKEKIKVHSRFICSFAEPYLVLEHVSH